MNISNFIEEMKNKQSSWSSNVIMTKPFKSIEDIADVFRSAFLIEALQKNFTLFEDAVSFNNHVDILRLESGLKKLFESQSINIFINESAAIITDLTEYADDSVQVVAYVFTFDKKIIESLQDLK